MLKKPCGVTVLPLKRNPMRYPVTPDGRYFVVRGRLWRCTDPALPEETRERLTRELMRARADVGRALRAGDMQAERQARARVHEAKVALGERGPVWWNDGAPDYNRRLVKNTPYAGWFHGIDGSSVEPDSRRCNIRNKSP